MDSLVHNGDDLDLDVVVVVGLDPFKKLLSDADKGGNWVEQRLWLNSDRVSQLSQSDARVMNSKRAEFGTSPQVAFQTSTLLKAVHAIGSGGFITVNKRNCRRELPFHCPFSSSLIYNLLTTLLTARPMTTVVVLRDLGLDSMALVMNCGCSRHAIQDQTSSHDAVRSTTDVLHLER